MLDVKTLKVLDFLNEHPDEAFSIYQMGKCGMTVNFETMQWLTDKNMVFRYEDEDAFRCWWSCCAGRTKAFHKD